MGTNELGDLKAYLDAKKRVVDQALGALFQAPPGPDKEVISAMKYSLFAGGKRLRPILCIAGAEAVAGDPTQVLPVACALELIHTYSLIHDDLPVMDDDDWRRGKPTSHKVFGEAMALLAGDGLLTEAFSLMTRKAFVRVAPPLVLLEVIGMIAHAAGYRGMIGGQVVDILYEKKTVDLSAVEFIHTHKTGALIAAAVVSGARLGGGSDKQIQSLKAFGEKIGLAFQISDDILDIEGDSHAMGKRTGADTEMGKATYPGVAGMRRAKVIQKDLIQEAIACLNVFDIKADPLRQIARFIIERKK